METDESEEAKSSCQMESRSITAIDRKSVHRICSGQVVLTLATAVKELVENSIDAGSTSVEIKLKEYGSESIEVIDNGIGVKEENFEGLTLKHHTSKLSDFDDLVNVSTFGFRGEALSSLCALSNLVISTRHISVSVGTRLEYDQNGKILSRKPIPKPVGTIVVVQNLFHSLPVRHKEFQRNLKKEFSRLVQVLNAYCLINTGVRISCVNQTAKGSRTTVVSTNGNALMRENVSNVFGSKQLASLQELKQIGPREDICLEYGVRLKDQPLDFTVTGFVSTCEHGKGRSSTDRQFVFINGRPCDATKILKLVNDVYHTYNRHQYPFLCLSVEMKKESVDVNVTPDKRQVFLDGEKMLLAVLKTSLVQLFEPTSSLYRVNNASISSLSSQQPPSKCESHISPSLSSLSSLTPTLSVSRESSLSDSLSELKRSFSSAFDKNKDSAISPVVSNSSKKTKSFSWAVNSPNLSKRSIDSSSPARGSIKQFFAPAKEKPSPELKLKSVDSSSRPVQILFHDLSQTDSDVDKDLILTHDNNNDNSLLVNDKDGDSFSSCIEVDAIKDDEDTEGLDKNCHNKNNIAAEQEDQKHCMINDSTSVQESYCLDNSFPGDAVVESEEDKCPVTVTSETGDFIDVSGGEKDTPSNKDICPEVDVEEEQNPKKKEKIVTFSLESLRSKLERRKSKTADPHQSLSRSFRARIAPSDNKSAEEELQREISKDMFSKMQILGQFNLGFIITRLGSDLFIVDQHATDEKFNFEMLQRDHVLQSQKMIIPQSLELTSSNETILQDNLAVFKKNGFDFLIQPDAAPTQRVKLVSAPVSKNWSFGKDDIEELLFMLMDSPNTMCRPTRVRMMFASRACRKSIMIGTALNHHEMKRLVRHMGEIEQPWNCPHGRPTMRHLFNLNMLPV